MKFITEQNIRMQYKKNSFKEFFLNENEKLTASARDFLTQRQVKIIDKNLKSNHLQKSFNNEKNCENNLDSAQNFDNNQIFELRKINSYILKVCLDFSKIDFKTYEELTFIYDYINNVLNGKVEKFKDLPPCTGLDENDLKTRYDSCFDIKSSCLVSEKAFEIVNLNYIRAMLQETVQKLDEKNKIAIIQVINKLSRMVCLLYGGNKCRRKTLI